MFDVGQLHLLINFYFFFQIFQHLSLLATPSYAKLRLGDPSPKHVHVYKDGRLIVKWDLENEKPIQGEVNFKIARLILQLRKEQKL